jgi:hypothetical protein
MKKISHECAFLEDAHHRQLFFCMTSEPCYTSARPYFKALAGVFTQRTRRIKK